MVVPLDASVTCTITITITITNDDQPAHLTLVKVVTDGQAAPAQWMLTAGPDPNTPGQDPVTVKGDPTSGDGVDEREVLADTYALTEDDGPGNYSPEGGLDLHQRHQDANKVTITSGAELTCTIVNTRDTAQLKLVKQVEGKNPNALDTDCDWSAGFSHGGDPRRLRRLRRGLGGIGIHDQGVRPPRFFSQRLGVHVRSEYARPCPSR